MPAFVCVWKRVCICDNSLRHSVSFVLETALRVCVCVCVCMRERDK